MGLTAPRVGGVSTGLERVCGEAISLSLLQEQRRERTPGGGVLARRRLPSLRSHTFQPSASISALPQCSRTRGSLGGGVPLLRPGGSRLGDAGSAGGVPHLCGFGFRGAQRCAGERTLPPAAGRVPTGSAPRSVSVRPTLRRVVGSPVPVTPATSSKCAAGLATDGVCARVRGLRWGG